MQPDMLPCVTFFQGKSHWIQDDPQYRRSLAKQTDDTSKVVKRKRRTQPQKRLPVDTQDESVEHPPALLDPQVELPGCSMFFVFLFCFGISIYFDV